MLEKFKKTLCLQIKKIQWKRRNAHNTTYMNRLFDINQVSIGNNTYGGINAITYEKEKIQLKIGHYCSISEDVTFMLGGQHDYKWVSSFPFDKKLFNSNLNSSKEDIVIEDDVWIGYGALIFPGVTIGQGAVVGAKAVVTKDIPPYAIAIGIPAKPIKYRFPEEIRSFLLTLDYSKVDANLLQNHRDSLFTELDKMRIEDIKELLDWFPKKS